MAFLTKIPLPQQGKEGGIKVDPHQVVKVFAILRCKRIESPVAGGQGIHEGVQAALEHGKERISNRVSTGTAQHGMLQDMRHPR